MTMVELVFDDLIEETLGTLYRSTKRPAQTSVGANALTDDVTDKTLTLQNPSMVEAPQLLEIGNEQLLVTAKSDAGVFTVVRGYNNTPVEEHHTTATVLKAPQWGRAEVDLWVRRWFKTVGNRYFPPLVSELKYRQHGEQWIGLPATCLRVVNVRHQAVGTGRIVDITGWEHEKHLPEMVVPSGQLLRLSSAIADDDELIVTWTSTYDPSGESVQVPVGVEDLPVLWASAYAVMRREVSRIDLDVIQEWDQEQAIRNGFNIRLARELWGEYYRRQDEARTLYDVPKHRPFRKMAKVR